MTTPSRDNQVTMTIKRTTMEELKQKLGKEDGISWDYLLRQLLKKAGY
jgi:predicted DNA binding CopG/RHH family protein